MPLSLMGVGTRHRIKGIMGDDAVKRRLGALGFSVGVEIAIVSETGGNLIIGIMDSRVAIDRGLALRIQV